MSVTLFDERFFLYMLVLELNQSEGCVLFLLLNPAQPLQSEMWSCKGGSKHGKSGGGYSSPRIVPGYGFDFQQRDFSLFQHMQTGCGVHPTPIQWVVALNWRGKSKHETDHFHLVPRWSMCGATPLLSHVLIARCLISTATNSPLGCQRLRLRLDQNVTINFQHLSPCRLYCEGLRHIHPSVSTIWILVTQRFHSTVHISGLDNTFSYIVIR
jgi:hypothetical protein